MPVINVLPKSVSELIAAGEVVERPSSVVKETVENSIDAGSSRITVEIKNGGVTYIRIADDGCGIAAAQVPLAFLRHATSKITSAADLENINTLGFRGEALAAISGVARVEMFTKPSDSATGTHYVIEGGEERLNEETGCPVGTTIIIRDLFYNTPARMKFLKKDSTEGTAVQAVVERMALSHPEIAFKFIRDGKQIFQTAGDKKTENAIYSVLGREIHSTLIPAKGENTGVAVEGFVCKPVFCRASRNFQFVFLNGRLVLSKTVTAAVEQAYKDSNMVGKFPVFILFVTLSPEQVDVNVHPAKTQVRFSDERRVFSAVYYAVKNALTSLDTRPEITIKQKSDNFYRMNVEQYRQTAVQFEKDKNAESKENITSFKSDDTPFFLRDDVKSFKEAHGIQNTDYGFDKKPQGDNKPAFEEKTQEQMAAEPTNKEAKTETAEYAPEREVRLIGEAFSVYIIAEMGDSVYLIDKHAAHERILYNRYKKENRVESQQLLVPVNVALSEAEHTAAVENAELLNKAGFEVEDFGGTNILVRTVPAMLDKKDVAECITEALSTLVPGGEVSTKDLDDVYHTVACKAAIKAGYITERAEMLSLAKKVLWDNDVMYCPHGRPVAYAIKKTELDKYFGRIQ